MAHDSGQPHAIFVFSSLSEARGGHESKAAQGLAAQRRQLSKMSTKKLSKLSEMKLSKLKLSETSAKLARAVEGQPKQARLATRRGSHYFPHRPVHSLSDSLWKIHRGA